MSSKRRLPALTLALALLLTSCTAMLDREYTVTAPHQENPLVRGEEVYRVETYAALQNALVSYVEEGMETGTLRFPTTYAGNLAVDLEKARRQLMEEEPLGAYAVEELAYHTSRIISYYEVTLAFTYRVPKSELNPQKIRSEAELQTLLEAMLADFTPEKTVYFTSYPQPDEGYLERCLSAAYDAQPAYALGRPELTLTFYPDTGARRIAVIRASYPGGAASLSYTRQRLKSAAGRLADRTEPTAEGVFNALRDSCVYDPEAAATPAAALLSGAADREGMTFAYLLLAQTLKVPCQLYRSPTEGCLILLPDPEGGQLYLDVTGPGFYPSAELPIQFPPPEDIQPEEAETNDG